MIALDFSGAMTGARSDTLKAAMELVFDRIAEAITADSLDIDLSVVLWNSATTKIEKPHATVADIEALRAFVAAGAPTFGTNFDLAAQEAVTWFTASAADAPILKRLFIFVPEIGRALVRGRG